MGACNASEDVTAPPSYAHHFQVQQHPCCACELTPAVAANEFARHSTRLPKLVMSKNMLKPNNIQSKMS